MDSFHLLKLCSAKRLVHLVEDDNKPSGSSRPEGFEGIKKILLNLPACPAYKTADNTRALEVSKKPLEHSACAM